MQAVTVTILVVHMGKRGTEKLRNCPKWTPGPRQGKETFLDVSHDPPVAWGSLGHSARRCSSVKIPLKKTAITSLPLALLLFILNV